MDNRRDSPMVEPASEAKTPLSQEDNLLACLLVIAKLHGLPGSPEAVTAGLPLDDGKVSPALLERCAKRLGLTAQFCSQDLAQLNSVKLPALLLLKDERACVALSYDNEEGTWRVIWSESPGTESKIASTDLSAQYSGSTVFLQPKFKFDARSPEVGQVRARHWFWSVLRENIPLYRDVLLAAFLINVFALVFPLFSMNVYDRVVPHRALETLWAFAIGVILVLAADLVLRIARGYFVDLASQRIDLKLSAQILERVLGMRMEYRPASVGSFASNLRSFETVRDFVASSTVMALIDLPFALLFLIVIGWISPWLLIPAFIGLVLVLLLGLSFQHKMHELSEATYRATALRNATLIESLVGLETLKALSAEGWMQKKWESSARFLSHVGSQLRLLSSSLMSSTAWSQQMVSLFIVIVGVYLIGAGQLSLGGLIASSMLAGRALAPLGQIAGLMTQYHNAMTALTSLDRVMEQPVERPGDRYFVTRERFEGRIELRDVDFTYPGQEQKVLRGISLNITAGEHVAILGRVGSGKSTLQRLMVGLYQSTAGAVLVDGIDVRQLDPAELRRHIGWVNQDATLFYGSLRENLSLGHAQLQDADLVQATTIAGLSEFINRHPKGFDLMVGERGETLSGGQRQAVAIARAVIHSPPILLLDEPTDSMDHSTEAEVKKQLQAFGAGKTLLIITHRTSLLELVDRIIVLDQGRIVADGPKALVVEALREGKIGKAP